MDEDNERETNTRNTTSSDKWYVLEELKQTSEIPITGYGSQESDVEEPLYPLASLEDADKMPSNSDSFCEIPRSLGRSRPATLLGASSTDDIVNMDGNSFGSPLPDQKTPEEQWYMLEEIRSLVPEDNATKKIGKQGSVSSNASSKHDLGSVSDAVASEGSVSREQLLSISSFNDFQPPPHSSFGTQREVWTESSDRHSHGGNVEPGSTSSRQSSHQNDIERNAPMPLRGSDSSPQLVMRPEPLGRAISDGDGVLLQRNVVYTVSDLDEHSATETSSTNVDNVSTREEKLKTDSPTLSRQSSATGSVTQAKYVLDTKLEDPHDRTEEATSLGSIRSNTKGSFLVHDKDTTQANLAEDDELRREDLSKSPSGDEENGVKSERAKNEQQVPSPKTSGILYESDLCSVVDENVNHDSKSNFGGNHEIKVDIRSSHNVVHDSNSQVARQSPVSDLLTAANAEKSHVEQDHDSKLLHGAARTTVYNRTATMRSAARVTDQSSNLPEKVTNKEPEMQRLIRDTDPMILTASALKASAFLSQRTNESIKRAEAVLASIKATDRTLSIVQEEESGLAESMMSSLKSNGSDSDSPDSASFVQPNVAVSAKIPQPRPVARNGRRDPVFSQSPVYSESLLVGKRELPDVSRKMDTAATSKELESRLLSTFSAASFSSSSSELMRLKNSSDSSYMHMNITSIADLQSGSHGLPEASSDGSIHQSSENQRETKKSRTKKLRKTRTVNDLSNLSISDDKVNDLPACMGAGIITPLEPSSGDLSESLSESSRQQSVSSDTKSSPLYSSGSKPVVTKDFSVSSWEKTFSDETSSFQELERRNQMKNVSKLSSVTSFHGKNIASTSTPHSLEDSRKESIHRRTGGTILSKATLQRAPNFENIPMAAQTVHSGSTNDTSQPSLAPSDFTTNSSDLNFDVDRTQNQEFKLHHRGIYDIRESSGPGSTNRRRKAFGKEPLPIRKERGDNHSVYVSQSSKDAGSSGMTASQSVRTQSNGRDEGRVQIEGYSSSLSTQDDADSTDTLLRAQPVAAESNIRTPEETVRVVNIRDNAMERGYRRDTVLPPRMVLRQKSASVATASESRPLEDIRPYRSDTSVPSTAETRRKEVKDALSAPVKRELKSRVPKDINELWGKFVNDYWPQKTTNADISNKLSHLSNLLSENNRNVSGEALKRTQSHEKRVVKLKDHEVKGMDGTLFTPMPSSNKRKTAASRPGIQVCEHCRKREIGTNFPTPCASDNECLPEKANLSPMTLNTWTQTTPTIDMDRHDVAVGDEFKVPRAINNKRQKGNKHVVSSDDYYPAERTKDTGIQSQAEPKKVKGNDLYEAWNLCFPKPVNNLHHHQARKEKSSLQSSRSNNKLPPRKKGEALFTAWFQSVRSDTSENTVIPLSEVPKLDAAYSQEHQPRMYIEERKETQSEQLRRITLQEAFSLAKGDFIARSKQRVSDVKNVRLNLSQRRHTEALKEQPLDVYINRADGEKLQRKADRLFKPTKRQMTKSEIKELNMRFYDKLPEVRKRREDEKREAEYRSNRVKLKQFDENLRRRWQKRKRNLNKGR